MGVGQVRVLFLADTHLGFDLPFRPRVVKPRRGPDFFRNLERVVDRALAGDVDLVVHGGDLLYRSRVPARLVDMAFAPLRRVADAGVPVVIVPGNHERSHIPYPVLAAHQQIHIFDRPRSFTLRTGECTVALVGFPYCRDGVRARFPALVARGSAETASADVRLLCMHHCFEGATVGPDDYRFRRAPDVVRAEDLPSGYAAVLSGHIHRFQVLTTDLRGRALPAPVLYPGSIERTSFAERAEPKGYLLLDLEPGQNPGGRVRAWRFCPLPARPMLTKDINASGAGMELLETRIRSVLSTAPADAVLRLRVHGRVSRVAMPTLRASKLRQLAPDMSLHVAILDP